MSDDRSRLRALVTQGQFREFRDNLEVRLEDLQAEVSALKNLADRSRRPLDFYERMRDESLEELLPIILRNARVQQVLKGVSERRWNRWVALAVIATGVFAVIQIAEVVVITALTLKVSSIH